jgi:two-component system, NtrC family, sensor kinase
VLSRWPIRNKLLLGIALLLVIVLTMTISSFQGTYAYRNLVRSISSRATELPVATALSKQVSDLRVTLADLDDVNPLSQFSPGDSALGEQLSNIFRRQFDAVRDTVNEYHDKLSEHERNEFRIGDPSQEIDALKTFEQRLGTIKDVTSDFGWYTNSTALNSVKDQLTELQNLATVVPGYLQENMRDLAEEVRTRYRTWIVLTWFCAVATAGLTMLFVALVYRWVFRPLRVLVKGSRRVACGDFNYRIQLDSRDEMGELADAMNDMTTRFRTIRDDLDRQVQLRTKEVVRSEQLASVGFLAAGVAHEINNPLASIALCAESLEGRLHDLCPEGSEQTEVVGRYLRMIQTEAFRCKEITEKLLDFSRMGEVKRQSADLRELIQGVIEMVRHLGKYQNRRIEFALGEPVIAAVNAQEIKQVVLNLMTNALDSVEDGSGALTIELVRKPDFAEMVFTDNGCGMTGEVLEHLFEPFFTRKRSGQGTGLGLSIVYRIVSEHGGQIEATSAGPGSGSQFHVTLPLAETNKTSIENKTPPIKESSHRYQAA